MSRESIAGKTTWTVVISCAVLGLVSLAIGLGVYSNQMIRMFIHHAYNTALHASMSVENGTEAEPYAKKIMEIYRSLTPEERAMTGTQEYRERFLCGETAPEKDTRDSLIRALESFIMGVDDVYIAMIDEETGALVYMADPGEVDHFEPGEWEDLSEKSIRTYLDWDGEGMLYDLDRSEELGWYCAAAYPVVDRAGETFAYVFVDLTLNNVIREMGGYLLCVTVGILVVSLFVALYARKRMRKDVAEPVRSISEAAEAYVRGKAEGSEEPCFARLDIHTRDELEDLSRIMADMEETISEHEKQIKTITSQEERVKTELDMAGRIQRSMLPQTFPPFPERKEFDIYASMEPARVVGGDFYDFFLIDEDHLALLIADVSGKGIPAALFMMISEVIIKSCAMLGKSASEILTKTNEGLCSDNKVEMFVTVWLGILEWTDHWLTAMRRQCSIGRSDRLEIQPARDDNRPEHLHFSLHGRTARGVGPGQPDVRKGPDARGAEPGSEGSAQGDPGSGPSRCGRIRRRRRAVRRSHHALPGLLRRRPVKTRGVRHRAGLQGRVCAAFEGVWRGGMAGHADAYCRFHIKCSKKSVKT